MEFINITKTNVQLSEHFNSDEFINCQYSKRLEFELPRCLLDGLEIIRNYFNEPIIVTSAYRPYDDYGYHKKGWAVDFIFKDDDYTIMQDYNELIYGYQRRGSQDLMLDLRKAGIEGFGIESYNCCHIDFRAGVNTSRKDIIGKFIIFEWYKKGTKNGLSRVI